MASITICSRIQTGKVDRKRVDGILLAEDVSHFRSKVAEQLSVQRKGIELIYCGRILKDNQTLDSYGVKPGVTVHVLPKHEPQDCEIAEKMNSQEIQQVVTALQSAMINPAFRNTVERMLNDHEAIENIITATPGLDRDPVAIAMLQDAEMLAVLADPEQVNRLIEAHPALGQAAMLVAAAVNEEGAKGTSSSSSASARATYSLDQMSDDEDMPSQRIGAVQPGGGASQMITTSQLAAALAAATGSGLTMASSSGANATPGGSGTSQGPSVISEDLFRQAMMESGLAPPASDEQQEQATEAQLAQLRDMGITDERVAREALQATNGDIQAALELIFGDASFN